MNEMKNKNQEQPKGKSEELSKDKSSVYSASGVNIDAGNEAVRLMSAAVKSTFNKSVLSDVGTFGGLFGTEELFKMKKPVLVGSTDGVGTKVKIAAEAGRYTTIGQDIVNHCIDDILVQGAKPLFFLDYVASSKLDPQMIADIVGGMAKACKESGCALIGGETAEMPGVYMEGEFDIAGTIVGAVDEEKILPKKNIKEGDLLIGLASDSPHTNGYSLIRTAFKGVDLNTVYPELKAPLHEVLLKPHRSYLNAIYPILQEHPEIVKALAHITGGGFIENIPRVIPAGLVIKVKKGSWPVPPLYPLIQKLTGASGDEMYRVFNMGIGMIAVVSPDMAEKYREFVGEESWIIGKLEKADNQTQKPVTILE